MNTRSKTDKTAGASQNCAEYIDNEQEPGLRNYIETGKAQGKPELPMERDISKVAHSEMNVLLDSEKASFGKTKPQAQHSALPWMQFTETIAYSTDGFKVCECVGKVRKPQENIANAKLIVASVNHAEALAEALRHSADKLNDLGEWLKAYAEPKQALSVKAIETEAREALANWEGGK